MKNQNITSRQYFKMLQWTCFALMASVALFGLCSYIAVENGLFDTVWMLNRKILYVLVAIIFLSFMGSRFFFMQSLKKINQKGYLGEMLCDYKKAYFVRHILLGIAAFVSGILYILLHEIAFIGIVALVFGYFFTTIPSRLKTETELSLDFEERKLLNNPDSVIL